MRVGLDLSGYKKKRYAERGFSPHEPASAPRLLLVGEAAGIDPITGEGIAQALLADAFAVARAHGANRSGLSTDSRTGALGLYEKVGMRVTSTWVMRGVEL